MALSKADRSFFAERRRRALAALGEGEAMLIFGSPHAARNADTEYAYRQGSDLWYLTGWPDPDAALLLRPGAEQPEVLFVQPKDREREIWTGLRAGPEGAVSEFGIGHAEAYAELVDSLKIALVGVHTLHFDVGSQAAHDALVRRAIALARRPARDAGQPSPDAFVLPSRVLGELRLHKTAYELELLRRASDITARAHAEAMAYAAPGRMEYELGALIDYRFRAQGGNGPGYTTIVGGGANACILHYVTNDSPLKDGELVLIDAGCELFNYTADVTRTFPVSGRFTEPQRALYSWVLKAQLASIEACRAGNTFSQVHDTSVRVLTEGMVALGLLEGEVDALIEEKAYKKYYMHGTSHWLGIDVHDAGSYVANGGSRPLAPGMVLTVEPGLYVAPDDEGAPEALRGLGVRIEDDVHVTQGEPEVLTAACPKTIEEVEAACAAAAAR